MPELPDYALTARVTWTKSNAEFTAGTARDRWSRREIAWGVWKTPESEVVPLPDASFDLAFSEYGASIWCDAHRWIPEAARLLRPGGELIFMRNTDFELACSPDEGKVVERLVRPLKGMHRLDWTDDDGTPETSFHLPTAEMFQLLVRTGFQVVDFRQLYARDDSVDHPYYSVVPADWARRWPSEEVWRARKREEAEQ